MQKESHFFRCLKNRCCRLLTLCIMLFLLSLAVHISYRVFSERPTRDELGYIRVAEVLVSSGWDWRDPQISKIITASAPLLTILQGLGIEAGLSSKTAGLVISFLFGSLIPVGVLCCALQLFRKRSYALAAGVLAAFHPATVIVTSSIMRESLYLCFFAFAAACALYFINTKKNWYCWMVFGFLSALAILSRKEGVELLIIFAVWQGWNLCRETGFKNELKNAFLRTAAIFVPVALICIPVWLWTGCWNPFGVGGGR